jgi:hypothetical protein
MAGLGRPRKNHNGTIVGPFTTAAILRGITDFLKDMKKTPLLSIVF